MECDNGIRVDPGQDPLGQTADVAVASIPGPAAEIEGVHAQFFEHPPEFGIGDAHGRTKGQRLNAEVLQGLLSGFDFPL